MQLFSHFQNSIRKKKKKTPKKEEYKEIVFHKQINKSNVKTTCDPAYLSPKTA